MLAIKRDGSLYAWGDNHGGELGLGKEVIMTDTPIRVGYDNNWMSVSTGGFHTVTLKSDGSLWTWGMNTHGQLGHVSEGVVYDPTQIGEEYDWAEVKAGSWHTIAIKRGGAIYAWGDNEYGQLGFSIIGDTHWYWPKKIDEANNWQAISTNNHTLALKSDGSLYAWGSNWYGALGDGSTWEATPILISSGQ